MSSFANFPPRRQNKFYVVFKGRKPGIYTSWIDCHAQVNRFKGTAYKAYQTFEEAEAAWTDSLLNGVHPQLLVHDNSERSTSSSAGNFAVECIEERPHEDFIIQFSMQGMLQQACSRLGIQAPRYTQQDVRVFNGQTFFRFYASLTTSLIGKPPVSMGRYATTEGRAREDVAFQLLRRVLACSNRRIEDFNYHNIPLYEDQIALLEAENFDLVMENAQLKQELRAIKRNIHG